jgi:beta-galactosidase
LREAAGFNYQEFSNLEVPIALKGDPFHAGKNNQVMHWAELLQLEHAEPLAFYDHPFFGRWPAITNNHYGAGTLLYEGTYLSDELQEDVLRVAIKEADLETDDMVLPAGVHTVNGSNRLGKRLHYYFNYSGTSVSFGYHHHAGRELLTDQPVKDSQTLTLAAWDVAIVEEP